MLSDCGPVFFKPDIGLGDCSIGECVVTKLLFTREPVLVINREIVAVFVGFAECVCGAFAGSVNSWVSVNVLGSRSGGSASGTLRWWASYWGLGRVSWLTLVA